MPANRSSPSRWTAASAPDNLAPLKAAGVDVFVAGSALFSRGNEADKNRYDSVIADFRQILAA